MILNRLTLIETIYENLNVKDIDVAVNIVDSLLGLGSLPSGVSVLLVTTKDEVPRSQVGEEYIINLESLIDTGEADEVGMIITSEFYDHTVQTDKPQAPENPVVTYTSDGTVSMAIDVSDPLSRDMTVYFRRVSDGSLISTVQNVTSGGTATGYWRSLEDGEEFQFYAQAEDSDGNLSDCSNFCIFTMGTGTIEVTEIPPINLTNYTKIDNITADAGVGNYKFSFNRLKGTTTYFYRAYAISGETVKYGEIFSVLTIPESYVYEPKLADVEVETSIININDINIELWLSTMLNRNIEAVTTADSDSTAPQIAEISVSKPSVKLADLTANEVFGGEISYDT